jgi:hypothetical protein
MSGYDEYVYQCKYVYLNILVVAFMTTQVRGQFINLFPISIRYYTVQERQRPLIWSTARNPWSMLSLALADSRRTVIIK